MDKNMYRRPAALVALVIVLAAALYLHFHASSEQQGRSASASVKLDTQHVEGRETGAIAEVPESSAPGELAAPAQSNYSDIGDLFAMVEWRNRGRLSHDEYPKTYDELRDRAEEGDIEATRRLAGLLRGCRFAALPMPEAEIAEIVAKMRETYSYPMLRNGKFEFVLSATGELSHKMSPAEFDAFIEEWHSNVMQCNAVTVAQREEADYWSGQLEAYGSAWASWQDATQGMDRDEKIAYTDRMWAAGDPQALAKYAELYADPDLQLVDPSARVKAYAYIYAYYEALIETAKYQENADRVAELKRGLNRIRQHHGALLSEHELRDAHELARQVISDNENCCIRLPPIS